MMIFPAVILAPILREFGKPPSTVMVRSCGVAEVSPLTSKTAPSVEGRLPIQIGSDAICSGVFPAKLSGLISLRSSGWNGGFAFAVRVMSAMLLVHLDLRVHPHRGGVDYM